MDNTKTPEEIFQQFWKEIICNEDGSINIEQLKKELADFHFVMHQVPKVYAHVSGGTLSKVMYHADAVIKCADDYFTGLLEDEKKDWLEEQYGDALHLIAQERQRQIDVEGWTLEHDDGHTEGEILIAAEAYLIHPMMKPEDVRKLWPWHPKWWKPSPDNRVRDLVKAAALIAAEIDRIQRLTAPAPAPGDEV